uniref:Receptor-interacting serine/threonine-protein kinase 1-like n=1 Tax=Phallusia mammillata TaxID=59560 RepID=A0A6F9DRI0_9ASCI|nr:receptor-interacting serine/threonine-protein kinase 1-like [Phallusia mammillata]
MEYCEGGALRELLCNNSSLGIALCVRLLLQTAKAIKHCHGLPDKSLIHCDLKPGNILLTKDLNCKLADFGAAELVSIDSLRKRSKNESPQYTRIYTAPEKLKNFFMTPTKEIDIYAFGITMYVLLICDGLFDPSGDTTLMFDAIKNGQNLDCAKIEEMITTLNQKDRKVVEELQKLMKRCWQYLPAKRPNISEIVDILQQQFEKYSRSEIKQQVERILKNINSNDHSQANRANYISLSAKHQAVRNATRPSPIESQNDVADAISLYANPAAGFYFDYSSDETNKLSKKSESSETLTQVSAEPQKKKIKQSNEHPDQVLVSQNKFVKNMEWVVGPEGATLKVGGCIVEIPSGALAQQVNIELTAVYENWGQNQFTPQLNCEPSGQKFQKPITISVPCNIPQATLGLVPVRFSQDHREWNNHSNSAEMIKGMLTFQTDHFTLFEVIVAMETFRRLLKQKLVRFAVGNSNSDRPNQILLTCVLSDDFGVFRENEMFPHSTFVCEDRFTIRANEDPIQLVLTCDQVEVATMSNTIYTEVFGKHEFLITCGDKPISYNLMSRTMETKARGQFFLPDLASSELHGDVPDPNKIELGGLNLN